MISVEVFEYYEPKEVRELEAYTTELETRIEAMKCCGNCSPPLSENLCVGCARNDDNYSGTRIDNWQLAEKRGE